MGKKPYNKNRFITYFVATILFFLVTFIFIISAIGYEIKFEDGKLFASRTGAIIVSTRPGDAIIYIDGKKYKSNSPLFRLFTLTIDKLPPGLHHVKIEKEGFENFEGDYSVEPSRVAWAVNLIMVAQNRESKPYNLNGNLVQEIESRDHSKILAVTEDKDSKFVTFNEINQNSKDQQKILEQNIAGGEIYRAVSYSWDGDRVLISKTKDNIVSYYVYDAAANPKSYPVSEELKFVPKALVFNPRNHDELYLLRGDKNLQILNYVNKNLGNSIAENITNLYPTSLGILATQKSNAETSLVRMDQAGTASTIIKSLPDSDDYQIDYSSSLDRYVVLPKKDKKLAVYARTDGKLVAKDVAPDVDWFSLTPATNFLFYKSGSTYFTYDIDRVKTYQALTRREPSSIAWFADEVNIVYSENSKIKLITREGFYDKYLFDAEKDFPIFVSQNSDNIFFTAKDIKGNKDLFVYSLNY